MSVVSAQAKEQLVAFQSFMDTNEVFDVKFYIRSTSDTPANHIVEDVLHVMSSLTQNKVLELPAIGDEKK